MSPSATQQSSKQQTSQKHTSQTQPRVAFYSLVPAAMQGMLDVNAAVKEALDPKLVDLVFQRVSQINGCAYCVDLHWRDLLAAGEDPQRINSLLTWREVAFFDARECAALNWAERVTVLRDEQPDDNDYAMVREQFSEKEIAALTFAIAIMNAWNRISISLRNPVARWKP